jgi:hypothetical protein
MLERWKNGDDGDGDGDGGGLIKQSYAASSLKLHFYWTINQNLQKYLSLSLNFNII